jgi:hypothetical protein
MATLIHAANKLLGNFYALMRSEITAATIVRAFLLQNLHLLSERHTQATHCNTPKLFRVHRMWIGTGIVEVSSLLDA